MTKTTLTATACATLLWAGTALATPPTPQQKCDATRITAWKTFQSCVEGLLAKDAKGILNLDPVPFARCRHAYFKKWTAFQTNASLAGSTCVGIRFTDNGDQTVTDKLTGLVWDDTKSAVYSWSTGAPYAESGTVFTSFLTGLNAGSGLAGANGWRLPTMSELQTIVLDFACSGAANGPHCTCPSDPCVDPVFAANTYGDIYWSATSHVPSPELAWLVSFSGGGPSLYNKIGESSVHAVRGGL